MEKVEIEVPVPTKFGITNFRLVSTNDKFNVQMDNPYTATWNTIKSFDKEPSSDEFFEAIENYLNPKRYV